MSAPCSPQRGHALIAIASDPTVAADSDGVSHKRSQRETVEQYPLVN